MMRFINKILYYDIIFITYVSTGIHNEQHTRKLNIIMSLNDYLSYGEKTMNLLTSMFLVHKMKGRGHAVETGQRGY